MAMSSSNNPFEALAALRGSLPEGAEESVAAADTPADAKKPTVTLYYERKGRKGKDATIIAGLESLGDAATEAVAGRLKKRLGTGGSARGGEILLHGDRREAVRQLLSGEGFKVKG